MDVIHREIRNQIEYIFNVVFYFLFDYINDDK